MSEHEHDPRNHHHHGEPHDEHHGGPGRDRAPGHHAEVQHGHGHGEGRPAVRHCDVVVIGGSAAGLAAALQLSRQRRSVIVVDSGEPRNAPAAHMHGYLGHEGLPPADLTAIGRDEVRRYGAEVLPGRVVDVTTLAPPLDRRGDESDAGEQRGAGDEREAGGENGASWEEDAGGSVRFRVEVDGDRAIVARRVLVATGLVDELPDIDGLAEHWGGDVIHCPFCHGYEVRDRRVVQVITHPMGFHPTPLFRQLTDQLTVVVASSLAGVGPGDDDVSGDAANGDAARADDARVDAALLDELRHGGIDVRAGDVRRVVTGDGGRLTGVELVDGSLIDADVVVVGPRFRARVEPLGSLGLAAVAHPSGLGDQLAVDVAGQTSVPGVYAAGNVSDPSMQVLHAAANGSWIGAMISFDLAREDLASVSRPSANEADWDERYSGDQLWSGNPNGTLVREVEGLTPGRALDVGAGEGGDAVWLAERGWDVTANDISQRGLDRVSAAATGRGLEMSYLRADANAANAFSGAASPSGFDLVIAFYASIPRTPDERAVHNLLDAVAVGGTLLVVSHDLEPMRAAGARSFDPDAYVRVDDVLAALDARPEWQIETHEGRQRPAGAATAAHHVHDVVLRARRTASGG